MAKIKYSALVSGMRNKLNGSVASRNKYGDFWRNKTTPVNAQTSFQTLVRSRFAANSSAWRGLTQAQRDAWIAAAPNFPFTDVFGDQMTLSGNALYLKLNQNLATINQAPISNPPAAVAVPTLSEFALSVTAGAYSISWGNTLGTGFAIAVYACTNISQGKKYVKNLFKFVGYINPATTPEDVTTMITGRFGTPTDGLNVWVKALVVSVDSGQQGLPVQDSVVAASV